MLVIIHTRSLVCKGREIDCKEFSIKKPSVIWLVIFGVCKIHACCVSMPLPAHSPHKASSATSVWISVG